MIGWTKTDGGRAEAGYSTRSDAGDCVARAVALAYFGDPTGEDYRLVYRTIADASSAAGGRRSARGGVAKKVMTEVFKAWGFQRVGLTAKANGGRWLTLTEVADRFPGQSLVCQFRGHVAAIVDGVLMDTFDFRTYEWSEDGGWTVETRERKTATVWLAPAHAG